MPEFEENNSQQNSTYSYTPSTSSPQKKGGRRRSGGFKSESSPINSKIGEVDPTEALKTETSQPLTKEPVADSKSSSSKSFRSSSRESGSGKSTLSSKADPQPDKATLDSIKSVEEKIAMRRAESEKNRPAKTGSSSKKKGNPACENSSCGLLAAIGRFFNNLFGGEGKKTATTSQKSSPKKARSGNSQRTSFRGQNKNGSGRKRSSSRDGHRGNRRRDVSKND